MAVRRINLLPPEIAVRRRARTATFGLGFGYAVLIVLLALVWIVRNAELNRQEERREVAEAQARELRTEVAALEEFNDLDRTVKEKKSTLAGAMANDVAWSRLMIELSMIIPGDSWLTSFNGIATPPLAPGAEAGAAAGGAQVAGLGTLNFSATTFDFPGVAKWISRLQELPSLQNIWVPTATRALIGTRDIVNYTSTADLSTEAASGRYQPNP